MAPLSKESLEVANSAAESTASQGGAPTKPAAGHLRSDALSLEIAVKVHGSRVTEVVRGITPHTEPFEEQSSTMIVFPQGAVLRMSTAVRTGQMLVLTNLKTRQDAICRVVKVRTYSNLQGYVEVEFTHRQPGYWGVHFPSEDATTVDEVAPPPPAIAHQPEIEKPVPDISWAPAPALHAATSRPASSEAGVNEVKPAVALPPPAAPSAKPESSFIALGSQEKVQPAASATSTRVGVPPFDSEGHRETPPQEFSRSAAVIQFPAAPPPAPAATVTMEELRGDEVHAPPNAAVPRTEEVASSHVAPAGEPAEIALGAFAAGTTLESDRGTSAEIFGARLESSIGAGGEEAATRNERWMLIGAGIAVLVLILGGGILYFRSHVASPSAASVTSPPAAVVPPAPASEAAQPIASPSATAEPNHAANGPAVTVTPSPLKEARVVANAEPKPSTPAKQPAATVTPDMVSSALNSHPVTSQRAAAGADNTAPALDAGVGGPATETGTIAGVLASSSGASVPPPPEPKAEAPARIGGIVKEPRLISSTLPVYPMLAQRSGVQGDVVIQTTIDQSGKVSQMKVISGPPMLRAAALDALRRWKYEPSTLDGQPVSAQMRVTIKFRR